MPKTPKTVPRPTTAVLKEPAMPGVNANRDPEKFPPSYRQHIGVPITTSVPSEKAGDEPIRP
jgi:hypothetical protein